MSNFWMLVGALVAVQCLAEMIRRMIWGMPVHAAGALFVVGLSLAGGAGTVKVFAAAMTVSSIFFAAMIAIPCYLTVFTATIVLLRRKR